MGELLEAKKPKPVVVDLTQSYKIRDADRQQFKEPKDVSAYLIRHAVNMKWAQTMPRTDSRIWAQIQDQLFEEPESLSLSPADFDWFFDLVSNCDYPAGVSSWRWVLVGYLEDLKRKQG